DLGESLTQAADCITQALIEVIDDNLETAEELLRSGYRQLEEMGGTRPRATVAGSLARVVYLRGRSDEAEELTRLCERITPSAQLAPQARGAIDPPEVLPLGGRRREAARELERAIDLYRAKGNEVGEGNASRL